MGARRSRFRSNDLRSDHDWHFEGGGRLRASSAPEYAGSPTLVDPEQAFTASLSSCHMLTFLAMTAVKKLNIDSYQDEAEGFLGKNDDGKLAVTHVILRPHIVFSGTPPDKQTLDQLHERAHNACFVANSVTTKIDIEQS